MKTHDDYFEGLPPASRERLERIQAEVLARLPDAQPCIGYQMPAFRHKKIFFYFAAFKQHIGIYPPLRAPAELVAELAPWRGPKGNLSFPLKDELPLDLIGRVAVALAQQVSGPTKG